VGGRPPPDWMRGRSGGRHCTADQYGNVPLGRHLVITAVPQGYTQALTSIIMLITLFLHKRAYIASRMQQDQRESPSSHSEKTLNNS